MAQPKAQAPFIPGQKEAADLVPDEQESSGRNVAEKLVSVLGSGTSDGNLKGDESGGGGGGGRDDEDAGRETQQGDYYAPVHTELVQKGDVANGLYSPGAGVGIVTSEAKPPPSRAGTEEQEQPGEASDAVDSGPGIVETGKGVATEVGDSLVSVRERVTEKLATLYTPSESLDAVKRALGGAFTSTKGAVQRTQQSIVDILSSSSKSSSTANQVVEDMDKEMLANSEGSGEDRSQVSEGPKLNTAPETAPETTPEIAPETAPKFMRAKL